MNETVWPCDWIMFFLLALAPSVACSDVSDLCFLLCLCLCSHPLSPSAGPSASSLRLLPGDIIISSSSPRAPSLSRVRKGLRASCPSLGRMNACPSWLDGTTDPITRCLPMRLFWTGIQRLSRYPPSRPFSCPNYELPLFFLVLILVFVLFVSVLFCASGPFSRIFWLL